MYYGETSRIIKEPFGLLGAKVTIVKQGLEPTQKGDNVIVFAHVELNVDEIEEVYMTKKQYELFGQILTEEWGYIGNKEAIRKKTIIVKAETYTLAFKKAEKKIIEELKLIHTIDKQRKQIEQIAELTEEEEIELKTKKEENNIREKLELRKKKQ